MAAAAASRFDADELPNCTERRFIEGVHFHANEEGGVEKRKLRHQNRRVVGEDGGFPAHGQREPPALDTLHRRGLEHVPRVAQQHHHPQVRAACLRRARQQPQVGVLQRLLRLPPVGERQHAVARLGGHQRRFTFGRLFAACRSRRRRAFAVVVAVAVEGAPRLPRVHRHDRRRERRGRAGVSGVICGKLSHQVRDGLFQCFWAVAAVGEQRRACRTRVVARFVAELGALLGELPQLSRGAELVRVCGGEGPHGLVVKHGRPKVVPRAFDAREEDKALLVAEGLFAHEVCAP
mmetsp:Transcript_87469/g.175006  ORF Transcript_87469/g.175006 Transcript_87469/m.175006 type:complete len:292 (-) Transcript_87469:441-1316(-)